MPNSDKDSVRYDDLSLLLSDNGFRRINPSGNNEVWMNDKNVSFSIRRDEFIIPKIAVEAALNKINLSVEQLEFYKLKFFK